MKQWFIEMLTRFVKNSGVSIQNTENRKWLKAVFLVLVISIFLLSLFSCSGSKKVFTRSPSMSIEAEKVSLIYKDSIYLLPQTQAQPLITFGR